MAYFWIAAPPLLAGAFHVSFTLPLAGVATGEIGADGLATSDTGASTAAGTVVVVAIASAGVGDPPLTGGCGGGVVEDGGGAAVVVGAVSDGGSVGSVVSGASVVSVGSVVSGASVVSARAPVCVCVGAAVATGSSLTPSLALTPAAPATIATEATTAATTPPRRTRWVGFIGFSLSIRGAPLWRPTTATMTKPRRPVMSTDHSTSTARRVSNAVARRGDLRSTTHQRGRRP